MTDRDLYWLTAERPDPIPLDETTTERTRDALLTYAADGGGRPKLASVATNVPVRRATSWPRRLFRVGASAVVAGGVATAALLVLSGGGAKGGAHGALGGIGVQPAAAAQLRHLSDHIRSSVPQPPGDATLVLRTTTYPPGTTIPRGGGTFTGADLYTDDGTYYYADTRAGLPDLVARHEPVGDGFARRDMAAAAAAFDGTIVQARQRMANAALDPNERQPTDAQMKAQRAQILKAKGVKDLPPLDPRLVEDNHIWTNAVDALSAGAGRPDVRAGVMHLLATIPEITVTRTTENGRPALDIASKTFPDDYEEQLIIDAASGLPLRTVGGTPGQQPTVTVTYDITRVTAATLQPAG